MLDGVLDTVLIYIPIGLTVLTALLALSSPLPQFESGNDFDDWLLNGTMQAHQTIAWQLGSPGPLPDNPNLHGASSWYTTWTSLDLQMTSLLRDLIESRWEDESGAGRDQRLVWLRSLHYGGNSEHSQLALQVEFLQELRRKQGLSKLTQMQLADDLFQLALSRSTEHPQDRNWDKLSNFGPMFEGTGSWMNSTDYTEISDLLNEVPQQFMELGFPYYLDAVRLLNTGQYDEAFAMFEYADRLPMQRSGSPLLSILNVERPELFDSTSSSMLDSFGGFNWYVTLLFQQDTIAQTVEHCLLSGELDRLQILQRAIWNLEALTGMDQSLALQQQMCDALPQSLVGFPGNTQFREARRNVQSVRQQVSAARYPTWNTGFFDSLKYSYDALENELAAGRPRVYDSEWTALYGGFGFQAVTRAELSPALQQELRVLEELDWNRLVLPADGVALDEVVVP